ncbi:MAG TPA: hypothetical protein PLJ12_06090, partial [Planctomycetota bacterium]|nr:hypothetical protein [Planctomycetota bacterium]
PIQNPEIKARVLREDLLNYLEEGVLAWDSDADGHYQQVPADRSLAKDAQERLMARYLDETQLYLPGI